MISSSTQCMLPSTWGSRTGRRNQLIGNTPALRTMWCFIAGLASIEKGWAFRRKASARYWLLMGWFWGSCVGECIKWQTIRLRSSTVAMRSMPGKVKKRRWLEASYDFYGFGSVYSIIFQKVNYRSSLRVFKSIFRLYLFTLRVLVNGSHSDRRRGPRSLLRSKASIILQQSSIWTLSLIKKRK